MSHQLRPLTVLPKDASLVLSTYTTACNSKSRGSNVFALYVHMYSHADT